jgi:hypothetical protein
MSEVLNGATSLEKAKFDDVTVPTKDASKLPPLNLRGASNITINFNYVIFLLKVIEVIKRFNNLT